MVYVTFFWKPWINFIFIFRYGKYYKKFYSKYFYINVKLLKKIRIFVYRLP